MAKLPGSVSWLLDFKRLMCIPVLVSFSTCFGSVLNAFLLSSLFSEFGGASIWTTSVISHNSKGEDEATEFASSSSSSTSLISTQFMVLPEN